MFLTLLATCGYSSYTKDYRLIKDLHEFFFYTKKATQKIPTQFYLIDQNIEKNISTGQDKINLLLPEPLSHPIYDREFFLDYHLTLQKRLRKGYRFIDLEDKILRLNLDPWETEEEFYEQDQSLGLKALGHFVKDLIYNHEEDIPLASTVRSVDNTTQKILSSHFRWTFPGMSTSVNIKVGSKYGFELRGHNKDGLNINVGVEKTKNYGTHVYLTVARRF